MEYRRRAALLALAGVVLFVGPLLVGAVTSPSIGAAADGNRTTLVGSQSITGSWAGGGAVYQIDNTDEAWRAQLADIYFDVTQLDDGTVLASFVNKSSTVGCGQYETPCVTTGYQIIDPKATGGPSVVRSWSFPVRTQHNSEVHAATPVGNGEIAVVDMDAERVLTVRDGTITWQWNASSFYNPPEDPTRRDWLHINDVDPINETHFLVSVRNANQLVVLERGVGVVEVINADDGDGSCLKKNRLVPDETGDVRCGDPAVIQEQHNPQWLDDGAVLVADSENHRIIELHKDETTGEWEPIWSLGGAEGVGFHWPRDADRLANGNTLITDSLNARVVEVTPDGQTVWSKTLYAIPYEADRLPEGELVGAQRYSSNGKIVGPGAHIPYISLAVAGLKGEFPVVPYWFRELHFILTSIGLLSLLGGAFEGWRAYDAGQISLEDLSLEDLSLDQFRKNE